MTPRMSLHVIYGIACAGKSTTSLRYASDNGIRTVISTDYLREVQRLYAPDDQSEVLAKVSHTAWELTGDPTPGGIIAGFTSHAEAVFPAVAAVAVKLARDGLGRGHRGLLLPPRPHHPAAPAGPGRHHPARTPHRRVAAAAP
jgi:2-phosphoglycerate kinase